MTEHPRGLLETYRRWPVEFVSGSGATLVDSDGREYVDLLAGLAVSSVGHAHPVVVDAIASQSQKLIHVSNLFYTAPALELASRLYDLTGMRSFFCNSGAEAIECAVKLSRRWGEGTRPRIIATSGGFHGRTLGALSATGQPAKQAPFAPLVPGFEHVEYGDLAALEAAMDSDVSAVILEPIQGEAGVIVPPGDYLLGVRSLCDRWNSLLILDEVQTGLGRTGRWFGHEHFGIRPDVMTLAKTLAGGLPMGACLASEEVAASFSLGDHATTFGGGPVQSAAALATLEVIEKENLVARADELGRNMRTLAAEVFEGAVDVRGLGMMMGVEAAEPVAREVTELALAAGVIVNDATPNVVRFTPPLIIDGDELDRAIRAVGEVWRSVTGA